MDTEPGKQGKAHPVHGRHVLPDEHAQEVCMVVVTVWLHFDVLPESGEAQRMCHPHVVQQSLLCWCGVDAIRPVALHKVRLQPRYYSASCDVQNPYFTLSVHPQKGRLGGKTKHQDEAHQVTPDIRGCVSEWDSPWPLAMS